MKLKVDLHLHTSSDLVESVVSSKSNLISPKDLIDIAVEQNFDAIAITHHGIVYQNDELNRYAQEKGLLLIPGVEAFINKKHVLLINFPSIKHINTYEDLCKFKNDDTLIIAPHPYYILSKCVGKNFQRYIHCFDAVEYSHFYYKFINPNKKALRIAKKHNLPVVGNSDTHYRNQFGKTYSIVEAEEKSIPAIIKAIKSGKVEFVSYPLTLSEFTKETFWITRSIPRDIWHITKRYGAILLHSLFK